MFAFAECTKTMQLSKSHCCSAVRFVCARLSNLLAWGHYALYLLSLYDLVFGISCVFLFWCCRFLTFCFSFRFHCRCRCRLSPFIHLLQQNFYKLQKKMLRKIENTQQQHPQLLFGPRQCTARILIAISRLSLCVIVCTVNEHVSFTVCVRVTNVCTILSI